MVLSRVSSDKDRIIHAIVGEGEVRMHLETLGFVPGTKVRIISRNGSNLIVSIRGSRVALDGALAEFVIV